MTKNGDTENALLDALLRQELHPFLQKTFATVLPGQELLDNWHLHLLTWRLEQCARREIKRLIICLPPRSLKSLAASVAFPAWVLGRAPSQRVICASYADDLARRHSRDFRKVVESPWYRRVFPAMRIEKNTESEVATTKGGFRFATSVGGSLTGFGGNILIVDDPCKTSEAMSEAERARVNGWYSNTLYSRLDNKNEDVIIIVMQRIHVDDLVGYVFGKDLWTVVSIPAIAPEAEEVRIGEDRVHRRGTSEALQPSREDLASLERTKLNVGSLVFESQFQQNPVPPGGNMIKRDWFKWYADSDRGRYDLIVQSWDTALATGSDNSYSACLTFGLRESRYYLLHVLRERMDFPALKKSVRIHARALGANRVLVEKAASGYSLLQVYGHNPPVPLIGIRPEADKVTRLGRVSALIEARRLFLPQEAPWLGAFLDEVLAFPGGKHDDQVDALSQFLHWAQRREQGPPQVRLNYYGFGGGNTIRDRYAERMGRSVFDGLF